MRHDVESVHQCFAADTAKHRLNIIRDDGLYRHLEFGSPGTGCMRVEVVTWPGYLAYTGDMGSFVFGRLEDMLTLFRGTGISPAYWAEKVQAADRDGVTEWSRELFAERALDEASELENGQERYAGICAALEGEVLCWLSEMSKEEAYQAIMDFEHGGRRPFRDWWEADTDVFTHRYLWCCFALVRIIELYDGKKGERP